eukprot:scaffold157111_cov36-Tisochrysis_lutea.AAC.2
MTRDPRRNCFRGLFLCASCSGRRSPALIGCGCERATPRPLDRGRLVCHPPASPTALPSLLNAHDGHLHDRPADLMRAYSRPDCAGEAGRADHQGGLS